MVEQDRVVEQDRAAGKAKEAKGDGSKQKHWNLPRMGNNLKGTKMQQIVIKSENTAVA